MQIYPSVGEYKETWRDRLAWENFHPGDDLLFFGFVWGVERLQRFRHIAPQSRKSPAVWRGHSCPRPNG